MEHRILPAILLVLASVWESLGSPVYAEEPRGRGFLVTRKAEDGVANQSSLWAMLYKQSAGERLQQVHSGDTLRSGEHLALRVLVDKKVYIYTLFRDAAGDIARLYPATGNELMGGEEERRVPKDKATWLTLDEQVGDEHLFVVAAAAPLSNEALVNEVQVWLRAHPLPTVEATKPAEPPDTGTKTKKRPFRHPATTGPVAAEGSSKLLTEVAMRSLAVPLKRGLYVDYGTQAALPQETNRPAVAHYWFRHR